MRICLQEKAKIGLPSSLPYPSALEALGPGAESSKNYRKIAGNMNNCCKSIDILDVTSERMKKDKQKIAIS